MIETGRGNLVLYEKKETKVSKDNLREKEEAISMEQLKQSKYQEYLDYLNSLGTRRDEGTAVRADSLFSELVGPVTEEEKWKALDSFRVNGSPMFEGATDRGNYTERVQEAMSKLSSAMVKTDANLVPYVQKENDVCEAIVPAAVDTEAIPEKPGFFKRTFKFLSANWRREVENYENAVKENEKKQEVDEYRKTLNDRAEKRTIQAEVNKAKDPLTRCNKMMLTVFGMTQEEIRETYIEKKNQVFDNTVPRNKQMGFINMGRENVPLAMALGMMAAETGTPIREIIQDLEKDGDNLNKDLARAYGKKFDNMFNDMENLWKEYYGNSSDSDIERRAREEKAKEKFRNDVAPHLVHIAAAFTSESALKPGDLKPEGGKVSVKEAYEHNRLLSSMGQGYRQLLDSIGWGDPLRFQFREIFGEMAQKMARDGRSPMKEALKVFADPPIPAAAAEDASIETARSHGCMSPAKGASKQGNTRTRNASEQQIQGRYEDPQSIERLKRSLHTSEYIMASLNNITRMTNIPTAESIFGLYNSSIEGELLHRDTSAVEKVGSSGMDNIAKTVNQQRRSPESIRAQEGAPFYQNAYVRTAVYDINAKSYYGTGYNDADSPEIFKRQLDAFNAGTYDNDVPKTEQEKKEKSAEDAQREKEINNIVEYGKQQSRQRTSLNELQGNQAARDKNRQNGPMRNQASMNRTASNEPARTQTPAAQPQMQAPPMRR